MVATKTLVHVRDVAAEEAYADDPVAVSAVTLGGIRTLLGVPLLNKGEVIGAFFLSRQEVRPFTEKQIELVKNFAAQAVIAIENARLLGELRQRTEEVVKLNQHLEQRVADQVGEIERMGRLRRFLPPQVADLIVASGSEKQLESHRREITALFCDLRGFTGFTESADAEDVMALLRDYHAAIGELVIRYSGTLERYAGDGVMVIFNDPVPVENPALQAVLMALEMRGATPRARAPAHRRKAIDHGRLDDALGKLATPSARRSLLSRRTITRSSSSGSTGMPRVKRCGSRMFRRDEKLFECPLWGVAERNSRCSNRSAMLRTARVNWLSVA